MNTLFWLLVAGLILLALSILLPPLLRTHAAADDDHKQRNIKIARQRLAELKQQLQDGALTQALYDEQYTELQLMLNDDMQTAVGEKTPPRQGRWIIPILLVLIPGASLLLYELLGETHAVNKAELQAMEAKAGDNVMGMIAKLEQRLQQSPNQPEGWKILARSYSVLQKYQQAADAYAQAYRLQPDDTEVLLQYASNLTMANGGVIGGEPEQLLAKLLEKEPDNVSGLWLAGMAAAQQGNFDQARRNWQKLESLLPPDSEDSEQVKQALTGLDSAEGKPQAETPDAQSAKVEIAVQVDLDPALKQKAAADATVFIYAQAISGPKMPLAIERKQVRDLPVEVVLGDSNAMQGGARLADHQQLRIVARVSASGQAMAQPGDLTGNTEITQPFADQKAKVVINQEVK